MQSAMDQGQWAYRADRAEFEITTSGLQTRFPHPKTRLTQPGTAEIQRVSTNPTRQTAA
jgi:hypothetical protein